MTRVFSLFLCIMCMLHTARAGEYDGNKLLEVLGEDRTGDVCSKVKTQYLLDKSLKNPDLGIKLTAVHDSVSIITAITLTGAGHEINDIKYKQFSGTLPFSISFDDDEEALIQKLGESKGIGDDTKMKFKKDGITVNVFFKPGGKKKIAYIKFTQNIGMVGPYRVDGNHELPIVADVKPEPVKDRKPISKSAPKPSPATNAGNTNALPGAATFGKSTTVTIIKPSRSQFYRSIMNVIESGEEEMFKDIKKEMTDHVNFWNYKYTYNTSISIPGEKYNMLYSFPFQKSQLDFVSVLEETDAASPAILAKYNEVEAELKQEFPQSDGWSYHYIANPEDMKGPKDFELKNSRLGSIVLDHSVNPYGKHVLYLRFLLQYN